jgi:hypothetical protein
MKPSNSSGVFVLKDRDTLVPMEAAQFASEDDLQGLLAKFPALLSGDQVNPTVPRKWLLVKREKLVPDAEGGAGRWSLDHLFLDQDGVPTLVEVKRQSDTRIRREVVGQMLDYAANCLVYWPVEGLQADLEETCKARGVTAADALIEIVGEGVTLEGFWSIVKTNLSAGRIRLLFVADRIPEELRRIIEFLNEQMDPAEVLGLELRQFSGQGLKTIVPAIVGRTEEATIKKSATRNVGRKWDEISIFDDLKARQPTDVQSARELVDWMKSSGGTLVFGSGEKDGSVSVVFAKNGATFCPFRLFTYGRLEWQFKYMNFPPFNDANLKIELLRKINSIEGISIPENEITQRPAVSLSLFPPNSTKLRQLIEILDWAVGKFDSKSMAA